MSLDSVKNIVHLKSEITFIRRVAVEKPFHIFTPFYLVSTFCNTEDSEY